MVIHLLCHVKFTTQNFLVKLWWNSIFSTPVFYWTLWPVIIEILEHNLSVLPYFLAFLLPMLASESVGELPCREGEEWSHLDMKCLYLICYILRPVEETIISYNSKFSSVQFSCSVMSDSLRLHRLQYTRLPWSSLTPRAYSNSCPSNRWCHPTISSSVTLFSSYHHFSQHQGLFQWISSLHKVTKLLELQLQPSVLPKNIQYLFTLELTDLISLQSKGLSRVFCNTAA